MFQLLTASVLVLASALPAFAQKQLGWKLSPGERFTITEKVDVTQRVTILDNTETTEATQTTTYQVRVIKRDTANQTDVQITIKTVDMTGEGPNADEVFRRLEGVSFLLTLDKDRDPVKIQGYEQFIQQAGQENQQLIGVLRTIITPLVLREQLAEVFRFFPSQELNPGDAWSKVVSHKIGPFGRVDVTNKLAYTDTGELDGKKYPRMVITGTSKYVRPTQQATRFPYEITKGNLTAEKVEGEAFFNAEQGRLAEMTLNTLFTGTVTVKVGKQTQDAKILQRRTQTYTVTR